MKYNLLNSVCAASLLVSVFFSSCTEKSAYRIGEMYDSQLYEDGNLAIRIMAHYEYSQWLSGGLFIIESQIKNNESWNRILEFRFDDPVQIPNPKELVKKIGQGKYYIYLGWLYTVSIDYGQNWHTIDVRGILSQEEIIGYGLIGSVDISKEGKGNMYLRPNRTGKNELITDDYGVSWRLFETVHSSVHHAPKGEGEASRQ